MILILLIINYFIYYSFAELVENNVFNCPNNGEPKRDDETNELIQCLPGWTSSSICGSNYSCFFSGFNYQCCPSEGNDFNFNENKDDEINLNLNNLKKFNKNEENNENDQNDCPDDALAVLDSSGDVMHCNKFGKCTQDQMFCFSQSGILSENSVCCENFFYKEPNDESSNEQQPKELLLNKKIQGVKTKFLISNVLEGSSTEKTTIIDSTTTSSTSTTTTIKKLKKQKVDSPKISEQGPKYQVYPTNKFKENDEEKYQNENEAVQDNENDDSAKNFLLEQIKQGWPYNDKYYREESDAEDIVVLRRRGRPEAIVHFPN